jgi:hypothetical protein
MGQWIYFHAKHCFKDIMAKDFTKIGTLKLPSYLCTWQDQASFVLTIVLVAMFACEPIIHCFAQPGGGQGDDNLLTEKCAQGNKVVFAYSVLSMCAMLFYYLLLIDLSVFSTRVSAFVLVCGRVLSEVGLFLFGLIFFIATFSCAVSALDQDDNKFAGIPASALSLLEVSMGMFSGEAFNDLHEHPALLIAIFLYVICTVIFLLNLLIAQLNCSYASTYLDMVGFARLNRCKIVTEAMLTVSRFRWEKFVSTLHLDQRCEFGEGDIGLAGGIQVLEPASANITTVDMIRRFGGSTSPAAQWPEEEAAGDDEEDRFDRMEKLIEKAMKRMSTTKGSKTKGGARGTTSSGQGSSDQGKTSSGSAQEESEHEDE